MCRQIIVMKNYTALGHCRRPSFSITLFAASTFVSLRRRIRIFYTLTADVTRTKSKTKTKTHSETQ